MKPEVVLIADAGPGIGWGHAVRQLALATALVGKGVRTLFVTRTREALSLDWPCPVWEVGDVARCELPNATVVYDLPDDAVNEGHNGGVRFDDYGPRASYLDYVVCPNFAATAHEWDTPAFLGPRFAPLRHPFNDGWLKSETRHGVAVYGLDAPDLPPGVVLRPGRGSMRARDMAAYLGSATVALVPPSMVALECLAIGTPVVLYVPGPKWQPIADAMEAAGVAKVWSGRADDHTLGCVLADDGLRRRMSEAGREAVDGRGSERLAEWLA